MFRLTKGAALIAAFATLFVVGFFGDEARAQAAPKFGHVDISKVLTDYNKREDNQKTIADLQRQLGNVLRRMDASSVRFLTPAEFEQLATLYVKTNPSDADKKQIAALEEKGNKGAADLTRLSNIAQPTAEQTQQLTALNTTQQRGNDLLRRQQTVFEEQLSARGRDIEKATFDAVRAAISKVAQEKGLSVVFDGQTAWYTGNDVTLDVVKQLNK